MAKPQASPRHAREKKQWNDWWSSLSPAEKRSYQAAGVTRYEEPDYAVRLPKHNVDLGEEGIQSGAMGDISEHMMARVTMLAPESERPDLQAMTQETQLETMGESVGLFLVWLFRGGQVPMVSSEDVMRRLFLVVRFAMPALMDRWEERLVLLLLQPGEKYRRARFALFDRKEEKKFRTNLQRPVRREVSLGALSKLGLGEALTNFHEVEAVVRFWFNRPGREAPTPSWVVRRVLNTAYALRPDLVKGYTQALLGALTGQGKASFSNRGHVMFDALGVHQALGWSRESRHSLRKAQMGHVGRGAVEKRDEVTEEELLNDF